MAVSTIDKISRATAFLDEYRFVSIVVRNTPIASTGHVAIAIVGKRCARSYRAHGVWPRRTVFSHAPRVGIRVAALLHDVSKAVVVERLFDVVSRHHDSRGLDPIEHVVSEAFGRWRSI